MSAASSVEFSRLAGPARAYASGPASDVDVPAPFSKGARYMLLAKIPVADGGPSVAMVAALTIVREGYIA